MKVVLTQRRASALGAGALLSLLLSVGGLADTAVLAKTDDPFPLVVPIVRQSFEDRREKDSRVSWKLQKIEWLDGLTVLTLAGLQFEEAFGLSVLVLDPPPNEILPKPTLVPVPEASHMGGAAAAAVENPIHPEPVANVIFDFASGNDQRLSGEPPRAEIQIKNSLLSMNDLKNSHKQVIDSLAPCENGRRRAVVFLRPAQTARLLNISNDRANLLTRYGRAACLTWNGFPEISDSSAQN